MLIDLIGQRGDTGGIQENRGESGLLINFNKGWCCDGNHIVKKFVILRFNGDSGIGGVILTEFLVL